jgi:hypothetical protein
MVTQFKAEKTFKVQRTFTNIFTFTIYFPPRPLMELELSNSRPSFLLLNETHGVRD